MVLVDGVTTTNLAAAAAAYVADGWAVLPLHTVAAGRCSCGRDDCKSPGKHPRLSDGVKGASTDPATVRRWWQVWPDANIGLATGAVSGRWVLDLDTQPRRAGELPGTVLDGTGGYLVRTGSGGGHVYFHHHPGIGCRVGLEINGVRYAADVRGDGGYVVAPPSLHASGRRWEAIGGDICAAPDWLLAAVLRTDRPARPAAPSVPVTASDREVRYAQRALSSACARIAAATEGQRHQTLAREVYSVAGWGRFLVEDEAISALVQAGMSTGKSQKEVWRTVVAQWTAGLDAPRDVPDRPAAGSTASAPPSAPSPAPYAVDVHADVDMGWMDAGPAEESCTTEQVLPEDGRTSGTSGLSSPKIVVNMRQMDEVIADSWDVMHKLDTIFVRDGVLVRPVQGRDGVARIEQMTQGALSAALIGAADWIRRRPAKAGELCDDSGLVDVPADRLPQYLVPAMLDAVDPRVRELDSVAHAAFFGSTGRLCVERGYHAQDRCWLSVDDEPQIVALDKAKALLNEWLSGFPFDTPSDYAQAVGFLVATVARRLIAGPIPITVFEAPSPGTGKSLLMELLSEVASGSTVIPGRLSRNDEERRKALVGALYAGSPVVALDNVTGTVDDDTLAGILTAYPSYTDRLLGSQTMVRVPTLAVWAMTANNAVMSPDIGRRSVQVRLDARMAHPEQRLFAIQDIRSWTRARRADLRAAVLSLVVHWRSVGCPAGTVTLGSYEAWARVVGGVVQTAGLPGWMEARAARVAAATPEEGEWAALVAWLATRDSEVSASDVVEAALAQDLLLRILGDGSRTSMVGRMGRALRAQAGRVRMVNDRPYTIQAKTGRTTMFSAKQVLEVK